MPRQERCHHLQRAQLLLPLRQPGGYPAPRRAPPHGQTGKGYPARRRHRAPAAAPFWPWPFGRLRALLAVASPPPPCHRHRAPAARAAVRPCGNPPLQQPNRLPLARGGPARFAREEHSTLLGTGRVCRMRGGSGLGLGLALALGIGGGCLGGPRLGVSVPPKVSAQGLAPAAAFGPSTLHLPPGTSRT